MNYSNTFRASLVLCVFASFTGCATTGGSSEPQVIHAVQIGDDTLECYQLQAQIRYSENVVAKLTKSVDSNKAMARSNDTLGALNSYLGNSSIFSSIAGNMARSSVEDLREIRSSHQRRRDILLQQHMHKQCAMTAQN